MNRNDRGTSTGEIPFAGVIPLGEAAERLLHARENRNICREFEAIERGSHINAFFAEASGSGKTAAGGCRNRLSENDGTSIDVFVRFADVTAHNDVGEIARCK